MTSQPQFRPFEDEQLSQPAVWAKDVLHVYNDNYLGIRAAASAMPGMKLVLPNLDWHYQKHLETTVDLIKSSMASKVVFHGMSNAIYETALSTHRMSPAASIFGIWHGGPSQWVDERENFELARFMRLDYELFARSHIMKPGCNVVLRNASPVTLVNCAPKRLIPVRPSHSRIALVPGTPSLHKNIWGNLLAADHSEHIDVVMHYAQVNEQAIVLQKSLRVTYEGPTKHQELLGDVAIVLNASTMDCHPMVDLEAAAIGRPSLHMDLHLGVLDDHPLQVLATVEDAASIDSILSALDRCLSQSRNDLFAMCLDYAEHITSIGTARFEQFLYEAGE